MFQSTLVSCFTCSIIEPLMWVRYTSLPSNTFSYIHSSSTSSKVLCPNAVSVSHQCMWLSWDLSLTKYKRNLTSKFRSNWKHSNLEELYYSFIGTMVKKGAVMHYNVLLNEDITYFSISKIGKISFYHCFEFKVCCFCYFSSCFLYLSI